MIWIFILADLLVFAILFAACAFSRRHHVDLFNQYQTTLAVAFVLGLGG